MAYVKWPPACEKRGIFQKLQIRNIEVHLFFTWTIRMQLSQRFQCMSSITYFFIEYYTHTYEHYGHLKRF